MSSLHFRHICKQYGKRVILDQFEVKLEAGQCVLLTGPNGAGKTTLMRILCGLEKPEHCEITTPDGKYSWKQYRQQLNAQVMYLHQQPYMFEGNVWKNLAFALPRGLEQAQREQRIHEVSAWAGLERILENNAKSLSGGECQRVAIARALLRNPQAMLLDEPTANMDREAREKTLEMIARLKQEGMALLVASHDPEYFWGVADIRVELRQPH